MILTEKKCSKCGGVKPAGQFYRDASSSTGLDSCCRDCRRAYARSRPKRDCPSVDAKICSHCCEVKPACEFGKNARESTGLQPWCRACHSAYVNNKPKVDSPVVAEKRCSKCNLVKSAGQFCKDKYKPSGLRSWCRQCRNLARAATRNDSPAVAHQKCRGCGEVKLAQDFPKCKENASGLKSLCQACRDKAADSEGRRGGARGALKRKASNVEISGDRCSAPGGGQRAKTGSAAGNDGAESTPKRTGSGSVESPFPFSIPTRRRSQRKGGSGASPTSQWNNGNGAFSQQADDALGAGWASGEGGQVAGQEGGMPVEAAAADGGLFSVSPFGMALDPVKLEQMSAAQAAAASFPQPLPGPQQQGVWVEAFNGQVQCPVFVPSQFPSMAPGPVVPCMQLVMAPGGEGEAPDAAREPEAQANDDDGREGSGSPTSSPSGLEVLAEAAEMEMNMKEVAPSGEVANN